ncbi:DUF423 domain-containing protein [Sedimenticola selenatireducens]|uniref:DUF423 domain-containing protein n=1 Tax=Sedimenticola selenatireducens TaxID=191960 RepID=UPI002AABF17F|nr:DUF423 domain-containing protein [Sedimenticola selenatireducens]
MNAITASRRLLLCAAISGFVTVALGAFGAHALRNTLTSDMLTVWQTGIQYQGLHTLAMLAIGLLSIQLPAARWIKRAGWLMLLGILLFSGSLYLMAVTGITMLGAITPFGGFSLLAGWTALGYALYRLPRTNGP